LLREIVLVIMVLVILMATASVMIRIVEGQIDPQTATLSLHHLRKILCS